MATYVNDLRLKEIATGDESGTWGTSTNTNLELIAEAFSYGTEAITTNADTHTTTIADGSTDPGRSIYLKYTGTLDSACTITIGPNTVSKLWFIENATSGSQNIIISQGSGANITIPAGDTKVVYSDGAGSGAAFFDAFANLKVTDPAQTNITSVGTLTGLTVDTGTTNGAEVSIISTNTANSGANNPTLKLYRSGVLSGGFGQGGLLEFAGQNASGTEKTYATISGDIFDTTASSEDGYLTFKTMQAGTLTAAMEIDHQGNVGIGTTSPSSALEVVGGASHGTGFTQTRSGHPSFSLLNGGTNSVYLGIAPDGGSYNTFMQVVEDGTDINYVRFNTGAGSEAMRIDSSGNVGIGESNPEAKLHVKNASAGTFTASGSNLLVENNTTVRISMVSPNTNGCTIEFGDTDDQDVGKINYDHSNNYMSFTTATSERLRIDSSGNVGIGTTSPSTKLDVIGTTNQGATIYATQLGVTESLFLKQSRGTFASKTNSGSTDGVAIIGETYNSGSFQRQAEILFRNDGSTAGNGRLEFLTTTSASSSEKMRITSAGYILAGTTSSAAANKTGQIVAASGIITTEAAIASTNGTVDVTVPAGGIIITAQSGYSEDASIFTFKADGGSQGCFGTGIGNSNWAFGTTSEPGGGQRNKVWVQTTNTLRFKDNGYGARTYQLTILSNTN